MRAFTPNRASFWLKGVPAFDSLMPPVRGDLPPTEMRPELGAVVPVTMPGAKTTLFDGPSGWQVGSTSSATRAEVRPRPPRQAYFSGASKRGLTGHIGSDLVCRS